MGTVLVKGNEVHYIAHNDKVLIHIEKPRTSFLIPIEKITGQPADEKKLTKHRLQEYLEHSKYIKSSLKKQEE